MNIKDRFLDFYRTPAYGCYTYDLTPLEQMIYGVIEAIGGFVAVAIGMLLVATMPIWAIPYLIYKSHKIKKEN